MVMLSDPHMPGLLVKPEVAAKQLKAERTAPPVARPEPTGGDTGTTSHPGTRDFIRSSTRGGEGQTLPTVQ
jgi:hypothetical protein